MLRKFYALLGHGRVDLRFTRKEEEIKFLSHVERKLVVSTAVLSLIFFIGGCLSLVEFIAEKDRLDNPFKPSLADARTFRFVGLFIFAGTSFLVFLCAMVRLHFGLFRSVNWEAVFVTMTTCDIIIICFANPYTSILLFAGDPSEMWVGDARGAEGSTALSIDTITTITCLFVPVRIHLKWLAPTCGIVGFLLCFGAWGTPFPQNLFINTFKLFALTLCALWGAWRTEKEARQNFLAQGIVQRQSKELDVQQAGALLILDRLGGVVLGLEADFSILEGSPRLAAMLFSLTPCNLKGKNFCDLISSEEDRCHFVNALQTNISPGVQGGSDPCEMAGGMVQLSLQYSHGRVFPVYIYYARTFGHHDGACRHMVALVEAQEREPPAALAVERVVPMDASSQSSASSSASVALVDGDPDQVVAWLDLSCPKFSIVKCSAGFTAFGPMESGAGLADMIVGSSLTDFRKWFQKAVNLKMHHCQSSDVDPFQLRLRTSPHASIEYTATCHPKFERSEDNLMCIVFGEVRYRRRRTGHTRQHPNVLNRRHVAQKIRLSL